MKELVAERIHKLMAKGIVAQGNCCGKKHQLSKNILITAKLIKW